MNKWMKKLTAALCAAVLMCGMAVTAYAGGGEEWDGLDPVEPPPMETVDPGEGFTEDGNLVTRDLLYDMMTRTASGSMNGGITAATVPLWSRTLQRGCRSTSAFTMSVSSRPRPPAFTSITPPSAPWTLGHSRSRPATPQMRSSTTISASRLKMDRFWRGGI